MGSGDCGMLPDVDVDVDMDEKVEACAGHTQVIRIADCTAKKKTTATTSTKEEKNASGSPARTRNDLTIYVTTVEGLQVHLVDGEKENHQLTASLSSAIYRPAVRCGSHRPETPTARLLLPASCPLNGES